MIQISLRITDHQHPRADQASFRRIDGNRKPVVAGHNKWAKSFGAQEFFEVFSHYSKYGFIVVESQFRSPEDNLQLGAFAALLLDALLTLRRVGVGGF